MSASSISNSSIARIFDQNTISGLVGRSKSEDGGLIAKSDSHVGLARVKSFFSSSVRDENKQIKSDFLNALGKEFGLNGFDMIALKSEIKADKGTPLTMETAKLAIAHAMKMQENAENLALSLEDSKFDSTQVLGDDVTAYVPEYKGGGLHLTESEQRKVDQIVNEAILSVETDHDFSQTGGVQSRESEDIFSVISRDIEEQEKPSLETMSKENASIDDIQTMRHEHGSISSTMSDILNKLDSENGKHDLSSRVGQYGDEDLHKTAVAREKVVKNEIKPTETDNGMSILQELGWDKIARGDKN
jgi:hypothetical protein